MSEEKKAGESAKTEEGKQPEMVQTRSVLNPVPQVAKAVEEKKAAAPQVAKVEEKRAAVPQVAKGEEKKKKNGEPECMTCCLPLKDCVCGKRN